MTHLTILLAAVMLSTHPVWAVDFNNDGKVDYPDFVLFASTFGSAQGDAVFDARFDLDKSGEVDFADFVAFAEVFGNEVSAAKIGDTKDRKAARIEALETAAKEARAAGDYAQAVLAYQSLLALDGGDRIRARGSRQLGSVYLEMGDIELASQQFKHVLGSFGSTEDKQIRSQVLWCSILMGDIKLAQGDQNSSALYFEYARTYFPKFAE